MTLPNLSPTQGKINNIISQSEQKKAFQFKNAEPKPGRKNSVLLTEQLPRKGSRLRSKVEQATIVIEGGSRELLAQAPQLSQYEQNLRDKKRQEILKKKVELFRKEKQERQLKEQNDEKEK